MKKQILLILVFVFSILITAKSQNWCTDGYPSFSNESQEVQNRFNRVRKWFTPARFGLFYHWGFFSGGGNGCSDGPNWNLAYSSIADFEAATGSPSSVAKNMVEIAKTCGAKYITLTCYHTCDHYVVMFPTTLDGFTMKTKNDYIGAVADECQNNGIKLMLYIPGDSQHAEKGGQWLSKYVMTTPGAYSQLNKDLINEIAKRYGNKIAGIWFDGVTSPDLPELVHSLFSNSIVISNNDFNYHRPDVDFAACEFTNWDPSPNYNRPNGISATNMDFVEDIPTPMGWYDNDPYNSSRQDPDGNYKDSLFWVKQMVSDLGQRRIWNHSMGFGPRVDGTMHPAYRKMIRVMGRFMQWGNESIYNTMGGGWNGSVLKSGSWNDGAFGSINQSLCDHKNYYVLVTTNPSTNNLIVPKNWNNKVVKVTDLRTGSSISYTDASNQIKLNDISWNDVSYYGVKVFKVTMEQDIIPASRILSRGENAPSETKEKAFDGDLNTKWLDTSADTWIQYQYNDATIITEYKITSANDVPDRDPKDWTLKGSNDGSSWTNLDTRTNEDFVDRKQTRSFKISNTTSYKYYRLEIKNNTGSLTQVAEIEYIGVTAAPASSNLRSPENPSSTVTGLDYNYYEGAWDVIPNGFDMTANKSGTISNFNLSSRNRDDNFCFYFSGYINIPTDGNYTFYTNSDDGSKLYIGSTNVVNNDGLHGAVEKSGTIGLKAGKHAIRVEYFEKTGSEVLEVRYEGPSITKQLISDNLLYRVTSNASVKLTGTNMGSTGSYQNSGNTSDKVFDGNTSTFFDGPESSAGNGLWAGLDLGSAKYISSIKYYPRASWATRMNGGKFQGSNNADFSNTTDFYTLSSDPTYAWSEATINAANSFRYVRYLSPNSGWGNVAEVEFWGTTTKSAEMITSDAENNLSAVNIYPNPASTSVTVTIDEKLIGAALTIISMDGKIILSQILIHNETILDITTLANANYILSTQNGELIERRILTIIK